MKHIIMTIIAAACFCMFSAVSATAVETLVLATVDNIPPHVYVKDGKLVGISVDIINEVARRGGFRVRLEAYPWARALLKLETGEVDGVLAAYKVEQRADFCLYTGIMYYDELRLATRKDGLFHYTGIESLYGKVIGKGRNVFVSHEFDAAVREGRISVSETNDMNMSNIKKLYAKRLDAVIGTPEAMLHYAQRLGLTGEIVLVPEPMKDRIPTYLVLSKRSGLEHKEAWRQKLKDILEAMDKDGTKKSINERYGMVLE